MKRSHNFSFMMLVILIEKGRSSSRPAQVNYSKTDSQYTDARKLYCTLPVSRQWKYLDELEATHRTDSGVPSQIDYGIFVSSNKTQFKE